MISVLTGASVDIVNFIPWGFTLISVLITIYTLVKKDTKEDTATTATVITKLENIQQAVNRTSDMIAAIQAEIKDHDHRITVIETTIKTKMGADDGR